ncbi:MAG: IS4 family transposase [Magnetovibrio sp.]|nr:IS4 family transposase [Magnetovibrio sp.]
MSHHNTILSQILKLVPRHEFERLAKGHDGTRRQGAMSRWTQFVAMSTAQLSGRSSLRDIESTILSQKHLSYHLGSGAVKRTTLSRANRDLSASFFEALFGKLYQRCEQGAGRHKFGFKHKLFSLDSTLLDVSLKVFPQANYNRMKAAFKLHVGLDYDGLIPAFAALTPGKVGDQTQAKLLSFPKGSVLVFDRGYMDYKWHNQLTSQGIYWVTRIRTGAKYRVLERRPVDQSQGVTSDQIIEYTSDRSSKNNLRPVRRVGYRDPETGKHYVFTTNQFDWSAKTIAEIYKQRWQVELFFKWIKQNLKIKAFLGTSENAVMTQVMVALCIYLILAYFKFQARLGQSLQQITRLIHVNLFARRDIMALFRPPPDQGTKTDQLALW